ncbi:MAG: endonuclease/exonuclease/phosphatase family protein [Spirochaetia bacterium]|nr:endonuclease/exonuclease/phosphatase family protein [Spirochaetia bacterium]
MPTRVYAAVLMPLCLAVSGCLLDFSPRDDVVVMSYNLMTLFDPVDQGNEYDDFSVAKGYWSAVLYRERVRLMADAILLAEPDGPDILVVQEAENERVVSDLADELGGYPYLADAPPDGAALGCGILSRYPVLALRAHRVQDSAAADGSSQRTMLEAELDVGGKRLVVLAVHWKSKLGGAEETEGDRRLAASLVRAVLAERLAADPSLALIVAGDFNENPDEYERVSMAYPTALMPAGSGAGSCVLISDNAGTVLGQEPGQAGGPVLYCPWTRGYSYRYAGVDERIDNMLMTAGALGPGGFTLTEFGAAITEPLVDDDGNPVAWNSRLGEGWSDHLPLRAVLSPAP